MERRRARRPKADDPASPEYARLVRLPGHADASVLPEENTEWVVEGFRRRVDRLTQQDEAGDLESGSPRSPLRSVGGGCILRRAFREDVTVHLARS